MKRHELARELAPPAPPCFSSRDAWLEFVASAAQVKHRTHRVNPLRRGPDGRVEFNPRMDFCADCAASFAQRMQRLRRCQPQHLLRFAPPSLPAETSALP